MRPALRAAAAGAFASLLATGCREDTTSASGPQQPGVAPRLAFTDVTTQAGVDMVVVAGRNPATQILEVKGGGLALLDRDNDGDLDLFVPNGATLDSPGRGPGCRLFDNIGGLRFVDVTAKAGLDFRRWGVGVAVGDVDGDGFEDIYITCYGPNVLLRNTGDGRFEDITEAAGVGCAAWSTGCAFGDVDGDGDLDLYVANYLVFDTGRPPPGDTFKGVPVFGGPLNLTPVADVLYANRGDGTFEDVTGSFGCASVSPSFGLGVAILDLDADGRQEILVGNDSRPNFLFDDAGGEVPAGTRRLVDRALDSGLAFNLDGRPQATMGLAVADVDGNGLPDVFSTNFASDTNTLHLNLDGRFFDDRTAQFGLGSLSRPFLGWAAGFHDFDLDGDEDLLVVNGHVYSQATRETMDSDALQPPLLFRREGRRFVRVTDPAAGAWLREAHSDRSAAFGDLDGDGDVDVAITERNGPVRLLRNDGASGHWLVVALRDRRPGSGNPRGLGSRVELVGAGGARVRWIFSGGSYLAASEAVASFGLGTDSGPQEIDVTWPDGKRQRVGPVGSDTRVVVDRADI